MFGFLKGKIEMTLGSYNYNPGDKISGTLSLKLKKPIQARELRINLIGERRVSTSSSSGSRIERVFDFKLPLDGEKTYERETYPFEIIIPEKDTQELPEGLLGDVVGVLKYLGGPSPVNWYLLADLDVPHGFDVSKKDSINIR